MKPFNRLVLAGCIAALAAGCASAPSHFYTLNATATGEPSTDFHWAVIVDPVSVPALVDRPQFTLQVAPNRVAVDEFNRWAAPLGENIARVVAEDLSRLLGTPGVVTAPLPNLGPACHVTLKIQRFESTPGKSVVVDAVWVVRPPAGEAVRSGRTVASEPVAESNCDAVAAAHSRALARVSGDIASVIRAAAGEK